MYWNYLGDRHVVLDAPSRNLGQTTDPTHYPGDLLLLRQGQAGQHGEFHQRVDEPSWENTSRQWDLVFPYWRRGASAEWRAATGGYCLGGGWKRIVEYFVQGACYKAKGQTQEGCRWWPSRSGGPENHQRDPYRKLVILFFGSKQALVTNVISNDVINLAVFILHPLVL